MKGARVCGVAFVAVMAIAAANTAPAGVVFTDTTFNLANYAASPTYSSDPSASIVYSSVPGTLTFNAAFTSANAAFYVAQGLANTTFAYDPLTQGAISTIDASVFKNLSLDAGTITSTTYGNTFHPTILQNGIYYVGAIPGPDLTCSPCSTGYNQLAQSGLTAADFLSYDFTTGTYGTANPNFSGGPMLFGLTQMFSIDLTVTATATAQYQDLVIDINTIPEPGSLALVGAALVGFGFGARRKSSRRAAKPE
jgi:hypothetical protein